MLADKRASAVILPCCSSINNGFNLIPGKISCQRPSEAFINMLAFLGWNPGTEQEIFSLKELVEAFSLAHVHKAGAKFDPKKTLWFQNQYLQKEDNSVLASQFSELLKMRFTNSALLSAITIFLNTPQRICLKPSVALW